MAKRSVTVKKSFVNSMPENCCENTQDEIRLSVTFSFAKKILKVKKRTHSS